MNNKNIIIHLGLHKTATTFLQKEIFPKLEGVKFFDLSNTEKNVSVLTIELDKNKINLISNEELSGRPYKMSAKQRDILLKNLKKVYPNAKIIIGLREKDEWIESLYKQYIKMKPTGTRSYFMEHFDKAYLDHESYVDLIKSLFDDVYIYHYEKLKSKPNEFVDGICKFIGVETPKWENVVHNKSVSSGQEDLMKAFYGIARKLYLIFRKYVLEKGK